MIISKFKLTLGVVTFAASVALGQQSFGETNLSDLSGLTSPMIANFEVHNCRPATDTSNTTVCDISESTLPGGLAIVDSSSGLTCVLNARSIPIWGQDRNNVLDFTEIMAQCDNIAAVAHGGSPLEIGLSVTVDAFPEFRYAATSSLPSSEAEFGSDTCQYLTNPETVQGQVVAANGWAVLSEIEISKYTLVSFAGRLEQATSSMCYITEANIAIFEGPELAGIIYTVNKDDALISRLTLHEGGRVRVFHGAYIASPIADLVVQPGSITLEPIADYTSYCSGRALVPNIYGKGILAAREELLQSGWAPRTVDADEVGWLPMDLLDLGATGAESCSGTGAAFCMFFYETNQAELRILTAGDNYGVIGFSAECPHFQE